MYTALSCYDGLANTEGEGRNAVFLAEQGMDITVRDYAESGFGSLFHLSITV